jgi:hypothetical protein
VIALEPSPVCRLRFRRISPQQLQDRGLSHDRRIATSNSPGKIFWCASLHARLRVNTATAGNQRLPVSLWLTWIGLFALRAIALFIGLDRLPLVPAAPPEVMINDPAVSIGRGYGWAAFSFEHSLHGLNVLYANFPPLYIALEATVFRILGLSAMTLRAPGALADLAACGVFLLVLRELYIARIVDRTGALLAGALILLEPTTLIHDRSGRMESLCILLGSLCLYLCVLANRLPARQLLLQCLAAIAAGLAMATHFGSLVIWAALTAWSVAWMRRLRLGWVALNALPLIVLGAVWAFAYGSRSLEAFHQLQQLARYAPKSSLGLGELIGSVASGLPRSVMQSGGPALIAIFAALALGAWRFIGSRNSAPAMAPAEWRPSLLRFLAIVLAQCFLVQFVVPGPGSTRIVLLVPFAVLTIGVALSYLEDRARTMATAGAALLVVLQLTVATAYLGELRHGWQGRNAQRFDSLVRAIPPEARVVAVPEFWFAFQSHNRRLALIYHADDEYKYWSDSPHAFDPYDVVILDPQSPEYKSLLAKARVGRPVEYLLKTYGRDFTVNARSLDLSTLAAARRPY